MTIFTNVDPAASPEPRPDCECGHPASYHINFAHEGKPVPPGPTDIPRKENFCRHPTARGFCGCRNYAASSPLPSERPRCPTCGPSRYPGPCSDPFHARSSSTPPSPHVHKSAGVYSRGPSDAPQVTVCSCGATKREGFNWTQPPGPHAFDTLPAEQRAELQLYAEWLGLPRPRVPFETYRAEHLPDPRAPLPSGPQRCAWCGRIIDSRASFVVGERIGCSQKCADYIKREMPESRAPLPEESPPPFFPLTPEWQAEESPAPSTPPETELRCAGCGRNLEGGIADEDFVRRYTAERPPLTFCDDYCNGLYDGRQKPPATPSSPERRELIAWLDALDECDPDTPAWNQARAAIQALYFRQREEIERAKNALGDAAREINCAGPVAHRIRVLKQEHSAEVALLSSQLERLKAEQLTPEEARTLVNNIGSLAVSHPHFAIASRAIMQKLRRLSDTGSQP